MQEMLTSLSTYGYILLFLYSLGGGMVAIIAAGVLAHLGKMDIYIVVFIAFISNAIGDNLLFYLSRYNRSMIQPYIIKHRRKLAFAHILMKRHGDKIVLFQKFIYGVKTLVPLAIGLTKYPLFKFTILNIISAFIWSLVFGFGSYKFGEFFQRAISLISDRPFIMPFIMMPLFGLIWFYFAKVTKKK